MPRAPRQCPTPGCTNLITNTRYCTEHTTHHWEGRSHSTGPGYAQWRRTVMTRAKGLCQIRGPHCTRRATDADHILNVKAGGARYDPDNGQAACPPCHKAKTQEEARRARNPG